MILLSQVGYIVTMILDEEFTITASFIELQKCQRLKVTAKRSTFELLRSKYQNMWAEVTEECMDESVCDLCYLLVLLIIYTLMKTWDCFILCRRTQQYVYEDRQQIHCQSWVQVQAVGSS